MGYESPAFPFPELPALTMRPLCQMFADKYYLCDKFYYTGPEFIDFIEDLIVRMEDDWSSDADAVAQITNGILKKLNDDGLFVHFNLR